MNSTKMAQFPATVFTQDYQRMIELIKDGGVQDCLRAYFEIKLFNARPEKPIQEVFLYGIASAARSGFTQAAVIASPSDITDLLQRNFAGAIEEIHREASNFHPQLFPGLGSAYETSRGKRNGTPMREHLITQYMNGASNQ